MDSSLSLPLSSILEGLGGGGATLAALRPLPGDDDLLDGSLFKLPFLYVGGVLLSGVLLGGGSGALRGAAREGVDL